MKKLITVLLTATLLIASSAYAGTMYEAGKAYNSGKYAQAIKLLKPLALKGDANAQFFLGGMYEAGQGVAQGNVEAYMWFNLAAITGKKDAVKYRDLAASIMTQQQLAEAQKLAKECLSRNYKGC